MQHRQLLRSVILVAAVAFGGGCESLGLSGEEITWQTLHAVDVAQTISAADDPCYVEDALITRQIIGSQPNTGEVLLWGAGLAVGHAWISHTLERHHAPMWLRRTWSFATITGTGIAIASNHTAGIRVVGDNKPVDGCY